MYKYIGKLMVILVLFFFALKVQATVVTFDDLPPPTIDWADDVPYLYSGIRWELNTQYFDQTLMPSFGPEMGGYFNGVTSGDKAFFAAPNIISHLSPEFTSIEPIFFEGAYFTSAWNENLTIEITAEVLSGSPLTKIFIVDPFSPTWVDFNWNNVTHMTMASYGGTPVDSFLGSGTQFVMDDFTYHLASVPVPAAVWLFGSGLIGLIGIARRKKS